MKSHSPIWRAARWIISRAANLTPEVVYYADGWPAKINEKLVKIDSQTGEKQSPFSTAAIAMACASHEHIKAGDTMTATLSGVTRHDAVIGDFEISVRREA